MASKLFNISKNGLPHPQFEALRGSPFHRSARDLMDTLFERMGDHDGNFISDFQGVGFHSRLTELACFAYLESAGLAVDRSRPRPDFIATRGAASAALEVVVASPPDNESRDIGLDRMADLSMEAIVRKGGKEFPRRIGRVIRSKLAKRYHELPHVEGMPLVLLVNASFEPGAALYVDEALLPLLYGSTDNDGDALFFSPEFAPISAIVFCNAFSVSRFLRLAYPSPFGVALNALRRGHCCVPHPTQGLVFEPFEYVVGDPAAPAEHWSQGLTLFVNPNALVALTPGLLPATSTFAVEDGALTREVRGFHPLVSFMLMSPIARTD